MKVAFLYEHPAWSVELIEILKARDIDLHLINVAELAFSTGLENFSDFDLAINRVNIMPSVDRKSQVVFQTLHFLGWLEIAGVRVVNGHRAHTIGSSKAMQNGVFSKLNLPHPQGVAIYRPEDALSAAEQIGYPIIVKPNIGGSGSGVEKFDSLEELEGAVKMKALDFGVDKTGIVQQYINSNGFVYRVEMLGDNLFYSIRQTIHEGSFNYCAADGCSTDPLPETGTDGFDFCVIGAEDRIQTFDPPNEVVGNVASILRECKADLGGVEYFIDQNSGQPSYYDYNPYSNFVTDSEKLLGFSAQETFVDYVLGLR